MSKSIDEYGGRAGGEIQRGEPKERKSSADARETEAAGKANRTEEKRTESEEMSHGERKGTEMRCLTVEERPSGEGTERRKERAGPKGTKRSESEVEREKCERRKPGRQTKR